MNIVWVTDTYSTATVLFEEMFTGAAFYHISGSFALQLPISKTRLLWSSLEMEKKKKTTSTFPNFTLHALHLLCSIWHVFVTNVHIGSFLIFSKHASLSFFLFIFLFTLKMSQSLLKDILHKVTLTKIISDSTQASGWARLSFPFFFSLGFLLYPYFLLL